MPTIFDHYLTELSQLNCAIQNFGPSLNLHFKELSLKIVKICLTNFKGSQNICLEIFLTWTYTVIKYCEQSKLFAIKIIPNFCFE